MTDDLDNGGASRDRTDDPLLAKQVLSQLSYGPYNFFIRLYTALLSLFVQSCTNVHSFLIARAPCLKTNDSF